MIILLIGPAGSGKTTLCKKLEKKYKGIKIYTTRKKREDDVDNYIFVKKEEFIRLYKRNEILTKTEILNNLYGLKNELNKNDIFISVGDIFTWRQLKEKKVNCIAIFLDVPLEECEKRLIFRGDDPIELKRKIDLEKKWGQKEKKICDYVLKANNTEEYLVEILSIIERLK